jgi:hypothetical protein
VNKGILTFSDNTPPFNLSPLSSVVSRGFLVATGNDSQFDVQDLPSGIGKWTAITSSSVFVAPRDGTFRFYAFGAGGTSVASTNTEARSGGGGGCAYGDIFLKKGQNAVVTISSGVTKVTINGLDVLIANKGTNAVAGTSNGVGGTATKHANILNGGAFSGGGGAGGSGSAIAATGGSSGSPLGNGYSGVSQSSAYIGGSGWGGVGLALGQGAGAGVGGSGSYDSTNTHGGGSLASAPGTNCAGYGRDITNKFTDALLVELDGTGASYSSVGSMAGKGGGGAGSIPGGFGGGGGGEGAGGFGGSAGAAAIGGSTVKSSGYAAGASARCSSGNASVGTSGNAICLIFY